LYLMPSIVNPQLHQRKVFSLAFMDAKKSPRESFFVATFVQREGGSRVALDVGCPRRIRHRLVFAEINSTPLSSINMLHPPKGWRLTLVAHPTLPHATVSVSQCDPDAAVTNFTQVAPEERTNNNFFHPPNYLILQTQKGLP
jgi:hypothetical protein